MPIKSRKRLAHYVPDTDAVEWHLLVLFTTSQTQTMWNKTVVVMAAFFMTWPILDHTVHYWTTHDSQYTLEKKIYIKKKKRIVLPNVPKLLFLSTDLFQILCVCRLYNRLLYIVKKTVLLWKQICRRLWKGDFGCINLTVIGLEVMLGVTGKIWLRSWKSYVLIWNKVDGKSTEKLVTVLFSVPFLLIGSVMFVCFESPLSLDFSRIFNNFCITTAWICVTHGCNPVESCGHFLTVALLLQLLVALVFQVLFFFSDWIWGILVVLN